MQVKKQQLEPYVGQLTGSKLGKEHIKPVYCHPVYLTYRQSTSCEDHIYIYVYIYIYIKHNASHDYYVK